MRTDVAVADALPGDAPATPCTSDAACPGGVCDRDRGVCVGCRTRADCADGRACVGARCVAPTACMSSRQCAGLVCDSARMQCAECVGDNDCAMMQRCTDGSCVARPRPCQSSRQCSDLSLVCDAAQGVCVECVGDNDCATTEFCFPGNRCRARVCEARATRCAMDGRLERCADNGSGWAAMPCPGNQSCRAGACVDRICAPGATRCTSDPAAAGVETCAADGLSWSASSCPSGQACSGGACVAQSCMPGVTRCAGPTSVQPCLPSGLGYGAATACPSGQGCNAMSGACQTFTCVPGVGLSCASATARTVCNADGQGTGPLPCGSNESCRDGQCRTRVCTPGATRCVTGAPTMRETCDADGLGWTGGSCPSGQSCSGDACVPQTCMPGATRCGGPTSVQLCLPSGLGYGAATACPSGQGCNAMSGACQTFTCVPGIGLSCASATARTVCNADGQGTGPLPCGSNESCRDGQCRTRICTPGATRCVTGAPTMRETCDADGLGWTPGACEAGFACSGGACLRQVCTPGTPRCSGTTATETCRADGLAYEGLRSCPSGMSCSASSGTCAGWVCTPGTASCVGNSRVACNPDGLGATTTPCGAGTTCSGGVCATWTCTPGAFDCADVNTRRQCNADGLGYTPAPCPAMNACLSNTCRDWICTPGQAAPACATSTSRQVCAADGQGYAPSACPGAANAMGTCAAGTCGLTCNAGYGNCDGNAANGCESNLQSDRMNCGTCGTVCTGACVAGSCTSVVPVRFSQLFSSSSTVLLAACSAWRTFRASLTGMGYSSITITGSATNYTVTCADPALVQQIADGLRAQTNFDVTCNGRRWTYCANRYGGELWLDPPTPCSGQNCPSRATLLRPCYNEGSANNFNGVDSATCPGPTQTITIDVR